MQLSRSLLTFVLAGFMLCSTSVFADDMSFMFCSGDGCIGISGDDYYDQGYYGGGGGGHRRHHSHGHSHGHSAPRGGGHHGR